MSLLTPLAVSGLLLSFYAVYIRNRAMEDKNYRPWCDISKWASCTKSFKSEYYTLFRLPNTVYGIIFYSIVLMMTYRHAHYIFYLSIPAVLASFYLAYLSYFRQKNFCIICTAIYLINIMLLFFGWYIELL